MSGSSIAGPGASAVLADGSAAEDAIYRKVSWRVLPLLVVCFIFAYFDRVNISFAKLQMQGDLSLSDAAYGLGASIFFVGYFIFEVPSNIIMHRVGAKRWIARIMITWGLASTAMMFVESETSFYILRFLVGAAEAGFLPGVILYFTYWFPARRRARINAWFMTSIAISGVIGGPLAGWIMTHFAGMNGWAGWQWLFLLEGLPTILLGVVVLLLLDNRIEDAKWLSNDEKRLLRANVDAEAGQAEHNFLAALRQPGTALLALIYMFMLMGPVRPDVLDAAAHQEHRHHEPAEHRAAHGHSLCGGGHRDAADRRQLGPHRRAPLAPRPDGGRGRAGLHLQRLLRRLDRAGDGRADGGGGGRDRLPAGVLDAAAEVPDGHGRGGRHCADQLHRQPRRHHQSVHGGQGA
jgi:hypothetical protein